MATDDGDSLIRRIGALYLRDEARRADDIEGGYAKEALGVVNAFGLENFGANGDGGVDLVLRVVSKDVG